MGRGENCHVEPLDAGSVKDPLGDRMKGYEHATRTYLPKRTYTVIRVDGKSFGSFTRGLDKPFDYKLIEAMGETTRRLCQEISGCVMGYVQSDEISLLLTDFEKEETQPWFGGNLQKIVSVSAAMATATFNSVYKHPSSDTLALFDARVFTLEDHVEAANCFLWRQQDAIRNAVSMIGQATFSHRELQNVSTRALRQKLLEEKDVRVEDFPLEALQGQVAYPDTVLKPVTFTHKKTGETITLEPTERRVWELMPAPAFAARPGNWLYDRIPKISE
jgi:tRNA(His) guanylyltransferase